MSDPKLISPLLDGIIMGTPISSHDGVRCLPAIKENSDDKYIVKIISIPASQVQLDALLLTGAYKDPADAMDYFKEVSDGVVKEAEQLQSLSRLDGFLSYDSWQVAPMEDGKLGYQVYLRSPYKRSLEKYMRRSLMTHLETVNLGLDLCAALAVCRRAGLLYVDLKPGNIFISKDKSYRIGDLGFVSLDSLKYTSLPGKYRSPYSPPEVRNELNTLNETVDVYALGMILYQIYNDGTLPAPPKEPEDPFPAPANADYEISEIIMKAVAPNPKERWQDPMAMGQALVAYMQRNSVNNTPIKPPSLVLTDEDIPLLMAEQAEAEPEFPDITSDDSAPSEQDARDVTVTGELSELVSQAEDLISHETPEGVVVPESVPLPEPEPLVLPVEEKEEAKEDEEEEEESFEDFLKGIDAVTAEKEEVPEPKAPTVPHKPRKEKKPRKPIGRGWVAPVVTLVILTLLAACGFWFYQNYYLQTIDSLSVEGSRNELVVSVETDADPSLLTVVCSDTYGNTMTSPVENGKAVFTDLLSNSQYKIQLQISGFHKLVGQTTDMFNTEAQTNVVSMSAITGSEDGSMMLTLTIEGPEPEEWIVTGVAAEEDVIIQTFTGHNVVVKGLTIGKSYTFYLSTDDGTELLGQTSLEFTASSLVTAENLAVTPTAEKELTVTWDVPENAAVEAWTVRCYGGGYDESQAVAGAEAVFTGIDPSQAYTVEVTASGMTTPARASLTADPISITGFQVNDEDPSQLTIRWDYRGNVPEGGWLLMYTIDSNATPSVIKCEDPNAVVAPRIPGASYHFELQAADSRSVFNGTYSHTCATPEVFETQGLNAENIGARMLKTPDTEWRYESVGKDAFQDSFAAGEKLSLVLEASTSFYLEEEEISILYVFRDGEGNVLPELVQRDTVDWKALWYAGDYHKGELDIPKAPTKPGNYSLCLYFNNTSVVVINFTITE